MEDDKNEVAKRDAASLNPEEGGEGDLDALLGSEHNIQVATAKKWPRVISAAIERARQMVTLDAQTARSCVYALPSRDRDDDSKDITGPSARFAELMASSWGNLRHAAMFVREEDKWVVARGMCIDLETNNGYSGEVRRRITGRGGKRYGEDMIGVTSMAAMSIADRNAVLKVIPRAYWQRVFDAARLTMLGKGKTFEAKVANAFEEYAARFKATKEIVLGIVNRRKSEDITIEDLERLHGIITAIEEGGRTWEQVLAMSTAIETTAVPVPTPGQFTGAAVETKNTHTTTATAPAPAAAQTAPAAATTATPAPQPVPPPAPAAAAPAPAPLPESVPESDLSDGDIQGLFK